MMLLILLMHSMVVAHAAMCTLQQFGEAFPGGDDEVPFVIRNDPTAASVRWSWDDILRNPRLRFDSGLPMNGTSLQRRQVASARMRVVDQVAPGDDIVPGITGLAIKGEHLGFPSVRLGFRRYVSPRHRLSFHRRVFTAVSGRHRLELHDPDREHEIDWDRNETSPGFLTARGGAAPPPTVTLLLGPGDIAVVPPLWFHRHMTAKGGRRWALIESVAAHVANGTALPIVHEGYVPFSVHLPVYRCTIAKVQDDKKGDEVGGVPFSKGVEPHLFFNLGGRPLFLCGGNQMGRPIPPKASVVHEPVSSLFFGDTAACETRVCGATVRDASWGGAIVCGGSSEPTEELRAMEDYRKRTGGRRWIAPYPVGTVSTVAAPPELVHDFVTSREAAELISYGSSSGLLRPSVHGVGVTTQYRNSQTAFVNPRVVPVAKAIYRRAMGRLDLKEEDCVYDFQLAYYGTSGFYKPHYDAIAEPYTSRLVTVIVYLNAVAKGGATVFPRTGLSFAPTERAALFFHNIMADGNVDIDSLHGGQTVEEGHKWIATIWIIKPRPPS